MIPLPLLVAAYEAGYFPMGHDDGQIRWYSPDPRGILPFETFHTPARLARLIRGGRFRVSADEAFRAVMDACAADRDEGTWITGEIVETYCGMHEAGLAHSIEVWLGDMLAGGLYGVSLGGAFFGESMFHLERDASKVALWHLWDRLRRGGYQLLDIQWLTPHLASFGAVEIPRDEYLTRLEGALASQCRFGE
jgi:leucyl/phenylalanyl-tRNA---protein transferase